MDPIAPKNYQRSEPAQRRRLLNIIYFVDSNRTHSIKIPLNSALYVAVGVGALLIWSFVGSALLVQQLNLKRVKNQRISSLLSTVFEYQTRYDGVYERTYPNELVAYNQLPKPTKIEPEQPKAVATTKADKPKAFRKVARTPKIPQTKVAKQVETPKPNASQPKSRQVKVKIPAQEATIRIQKQTLRITKKKATVSFAIQNKISPNRAEGQIWGVATILNAKGRLVQVTSPQGIHHSKNKVPKNIEKAQKFSIRYYKSKTLVFDLLPGSKLASLDIFCHQRNKVFKLASVNIPEAPPQKGVAKIEKTTPAVSKK